MNGNKFWGSIEIKPGDITSILDEAEIFDNLELAEQLAYDVNEVRQPDAPVFVVVSLDELRKRHKD